MLVDTEGQSVLVEIVDRVEMLQEGVTYQEQVLVLSWESAFMDNEVTFFMTRFV